MSYFIPTMLRAGFIDSPPESNVRPLPTRPSTTSRRRRRGRSVAHRDQPGGSDAAWATAANTPIPLALDPALVAHPGRDSAVLAGDRPGALGQLGRPHVAGRSVLQVAGAANRVGDRRGALDGRPVAAHDCQRLQGFCPILGSLGAIAIEAVGRGGHALDHVPAGLVGTERKRLGCEREPANAGRECRPRNGTGRLSGLIGADGVRRAEADHRHPQRPHARALGVQHRHLAQASPDLSGGDQCGDAAAEGAIQRLHRARRPAPAWLRRRPAYRQEWTRAGFGWLKFACRLVVGNNSRAS